MSRHDPTLVYDTIESQRVSDGICDALRDAVPTAGGRQCERGIALSTRAGRDLQSPAPSRSAIVIGSERLLWLPNLAWMFPASSGDCHE